MDGRNLSPKGELSILRLFITADCCSGGELNYLNHLLKKPPYLATCLFGWTFILVGNSAANCISFGSHVLKAAYNNETPSPGLTTLVALAAAWVVFLTHSLGRMAGIHLNTAFAMLKVAILLMIVILGFMVRGNAVHYMSPTSEFPSDLGNFTFLANKTSWGYPFLVNGTYFYPSTNLNPTTSFREIGTNRPSGARFASAYLNIIFTFGGWNQANYVSSKIRRFTIILLTCFHRYWVKSKNQAPGFETQPCGVLWA